MPRGNPIWSLEHSGILAAVTGQNPLPAASTQPEQGLPNIAENGFLNNLRTIPQSSILVPRRIPQLPWVSSGGRSLLQRNVERS